MDKKTIQSKSEEIKKIYQEYFEKFSGLEKERKKIIDDFARILENKKIEEIKNRLQSL